MLKMKNKKIVRADASALRRALDSVKKGTSIRKGSVQYPSSENPTLGEFLKRHKLDKSFVFDAKFRSLSEVRVSMKNVGAHFAYNSVRCYKGHTFRDRNNHCVICDSSRISFQLRNSKEGYVYIAGSLIGRMIKIGVAILISDRERSLNKEAYAGYSDWKILYSFRSKNIGQIENLVIDKLICYRTSVPYVHSGCRRVAKEVFFCSFTKMYSTLREIIEKENFMISKELLKKEVTRSYEFRNLCKQV